MTKPKTDAIIHTATTPKQILACWEAVHMLRPSLAKEDFLPMVHRMQATGYVLLYIAEEDAVVSIAGYRIAEVLHSGKMLYVEDLSTLEAAQGKGLATLLLHQLAGIARANGCATLQLASGVHRAPAHRVYFKEGFNIIGYHFMKVL